MAHRVERLSIGVVAEKANGAGPVAPDPFNLEALRLPPSYEMDAGVRLQLTSVPVRKPKRQEWIRVHHDSAYRIDVALIKMDDDGAFYLVHPNVLPAIEHETVGYTIYTTVNKSGTGFLWPISRPKDADRRPNEWVRSAHVAAAQAVTQWVRVASNNDRGAYDIYNSQNQLSDPVWPEKTMLELLKIAFQTTGRYIETLDHPVVKTLQGR
jgi:hypothetical protein